MKVKKLFGSTLLIAGLMLTVFTSCESQDVKTEKSLDGDWIVTSVKMVETQADTVVTDTIYTGAVNPMGLSEILIQEDGRTAYVSMMTRYMKASYQVLGNDLILKLEDYPEAILLTIESIDKSNAVLTMRSEDWDWDWDEHYEETGEPDWYKESRTVTIYLSKQ